MAQYRIELRSGTIRSITADNVHTSEQGHIKLLNGKGRDAELVAFYNAADVVSVEVEGAKQAN